jgi:SMODS-associating 2TM, beta-strand rich effector domain
MTAHEYAIIGHKRAEIGRWLGFASVLLAPILTSVITWASGWPLLMASIQTKMVAFTVSTGLVYTVLYWVFNRYVWRWLNKLLSIPDLSGTWSVSGKSLTLEGDVKFVWSGILTITQKWDRIAIELKTNQSGSFSETASVLLKHDGAAKLSYSYQNHPKAGEAELQKHQGFCELTFEGSRSSAEGHYFNSLGHYSFGQMQLMRAANAS